MRRPAGPREFARLAALPSRDVQSARWDASLALDRLTEAAAERSPGMRAQAVRAALDELELVAAALGFSLSPLPTPEDLAA